MALDKSLHKWLYCRRGWHRWNSSSLQVTNSKGDHIRSSWVECYVCGLLHFPSKHYKKNYLRIKDQEKSMMNNLFADIKNEAMKNDS